ncbi:MAG: glycosyltransferase family 9 protein [Nitrospinae bacterium]|nr:glycosyltransferase family 9 protein [Nitrospinota bacterium]
MRILKNLILSFFNYLWKLKLFILKPAPPQKIEKILILPRTGIGDMIMLIPFLNSLKNYFPDSELTFIISPNRGLGELAEDTGHIDNIIEYDFVKNWQLHKILKLAYKIEGEFDVSFSCWGFPVNVLPFIKSRYSIGFNHQLGYDKKSQFLLDYAVKLDADSVKQHDVQRYLNLLEPLKTSPSFHSFEGGEKGGVVNLGPFLKVREEDKIYIDHLLKKDNILNGDILIGFHAGSNSDQPEKRWSKEKFIDLGKYLSKEYKAKVIIVGSAGEKEFAGDIAEKINGVNLAGETTVMQTAALIHRCKIFISNDTGPMHIAAAVGTPVVALFGPTDPCINGPYTDKAVIVNKELACSPCYIPYSSRINCETLECMNLISVEEVINKIKGLITT